MITFLEQLEKPLFYPFWAKIKFLKNWVCQLLEKKQKTTNERQ